jgi:hypothetical protein
VKATVRGRSARPFLAAGVVAVLLVFAATPGHASAATVKQPTVLRMELPGTIELGVHPRAKVSLTSNGAPVAGQLVSVHLGTRVSLNLTTGSDGTAAGDLSRDLRAGTYQAVATFAGTTTYRSSSSARLGFVVQPLELTIDTVPSMPDLPLLQIGNGAVLKTGADGSVHVTVTAVGNLALKLALPADSPARRFRLDRWEDGSTDVNRTIRIPDTLRVTVGLQVLYPIEFAFSASDGSAFAAADVPVVGIANGAGAEQTLSGPAPYWLAANAIVRQVDGLVSTEVDYRIVSVPLDGADVVNRGQQHFAADVAKTIPVELLVFYLSVQGRDSLLRTSTGSSVKIISANGSTQVVTLDRDARATVRLPRGVYRLAVGGSLGIPLTAPVALSRDQAVDLLLISVLDIALVLVIAIALAVGLIVIGRPHVLPRRKGGPPSDPGDGDEPPMPPMPPLPEWPSTPQSVPRARTGP